MSLTLTRGAPLALLALVVLSSGSAAQSTPAAGTPRRLTLDEAVRMAEARSEAVQVARAGVTRATGQHLQSRSALMPQLNGMLSYSKALASQFEGLSFGGGAPDTTQPQSVCAPRIPPGATPAQRQAALDQATTCQQGGGGFDFSSVGFGAKNQWTAALQFSQSLWTGGRIQGYTTASAAQLRAAEVEVNAQRAQTALDVTQAYFDAALTQRLVAIADSALSQTEEVLRQTRVARQVGNQSEFDLLRAQVTRDNQVPVAIQRRSDRQIAFLRLKQLLDLPLDADIELATSFDEAADSAAVPAQAAVLEVGGSTRPDTSTSMRAPVRQLEQAVAAQEGLLRAARAEYLPAVSLTSGYQRLYFPNTVFPDLSNGRNNWNVGVSASIPIFNGGRTRGGVMMAEASLAEMRARLQQTRELAALDTRMALAALEQAEAAYRASAGTAEQANRAYRIDQIRFREGISTQTDLSQSRLLLEQSLAIRAVAARDYAVARVRLALLRDLPLQLGNMQSRGSSTSTPQGGSAQPSQGQQQQNPQQGAQQGSQGMTP